MDRFWRSYALVHRDITGDERAGRDAELADFASRLSLLGPDSFEHNRDCLVVNPGNGPAWANRIHRSSRYCLVAAEHCLASVGAAFSPSSFRRKKLEHGFLISQFGRAWVVACDGGHCLVRRQF